MGVFLEYQLKDFLDLSFDSGYDVKRGKNSYKIFIAITC